MSVGIGGAIPAAVGSLRATPSSSWRREGASGHCPGLRGLPRAVVVQEKVWRCWNWKRRVFLGGIVLAKRCEVCDELFARQSGILVLYRGR